MLISLSVREAVLQGGRAYVRTFQISGEDFVRADFGRGRHEIYEAFAASHQRGVV